MFTGIITDVGSVLEVTSYGPGLRRIRIACAYPVQSIALGASIACSGPCLTVVATGQEGGRDWFEVDAATETLALTTVDFWKTGTRLNLERALKIGDELGGHIVTGHVDGVTSIVSREDIAADAASPWGATVRFVLRAPEPLHRFIAKKGSVTLDGISLTVNSAEQDLYSVLIIPHTLQGTTLGERKAGDSVNLEIDLMARYAARLTETA